MLRRDLIRTKVKEIGESSRLVKENLPGEFEKFARLGLVKDGIYKRIEFCIQNALDICSIINSDLKLGIPSSEEDIIENLVRSEILSAELGKTLNRMRGFRNILVHRYGRINDEMAFQHKKEGLKDFDRFAEAIEKAMPELERRSQQL